MVSTANENEKKIDEEEVIVEEKEDKDNKTDDENVSKETDDENNSSPGFATSSEGQRSPPPSMVFGPNNPYLVNPNMMYINCINPYLQVRAFHLFQFFQLNRKCTQTLFSILLKT